MPTNKPIRILFCILSTHERNGWWTPQLGAFVADLPHLQGYATAVVPLHNFVPAAAARNIICKRVIENPDQFDWLCMIDNDMAPTGELFDTVKDAPPEADIVVPEFWMFDEYQKKIKLCWRALSQGMSDEPIKLESGFHEALKCGTGAIFIRPKCLLKVPYPYFTYVYDEDGNQTGSEDISFTEKARKHGVRIFGNNQIAVGHYKSVNLSVMAEMVFTNKSLDAPLTQSVESQAVTECPSVEAAAKS